MAAGLLRTFFHATVLIYYAYVDHVIMAGMGKTHLVLGMESDDPRLLRWQGGVPYYYTFWNMTLHKVYFTCCCIENLLSYVQSTGPIHLHDTARAARRIILASLLFPVAILVTVSFWAVYFMKPDGMFSEFLFATPSWVNHACHTFIVPIVLLEVYFRATTEVIWGTGSYRPYWVIHSFNTIYSLTSTASWLMRGCWPYPFLDHLSLREHILFNAYIYISSTLWVVLQNSMTNNIRGMSVREESKGSKLRKITPKKKN